MGVCIHWNFKDFTITKKSLSVYPKSTKTLRCTFESDSLSFFRNTRFSFFWAREARKRVSQNYVDNKRHAQNLFEMLQIHCLNGEIWVITLIIVMDIIELVIIWLVRIICHINFFRFRFLRERHTNSAFKSRMYDLFHRKLHKLRIYPPFVILEKSLKNDDN
jgi:hypothetical protein